MGSAKMSVSIVLREGMKTKTHSPMLPNTLCAASLLCVVIQSSSESTEAEEGGEREDGRGSGDEECEREKREGRGEERRRRERSRCRMGGIEWTTSTKPRECSKREKKRKRSSRTPREETS